MKRAAQNTLSPYSLYITTHRTAGKLTSDQIVFAEVFGASVEQGNPESIPYAEWFHSQPAQIESRKQWESGLAEQEIEAPFYSEYERPRSPRLCGSCGAQGACPCSSAGNGWS